MKKFIPFLFLIVGLLMQNCRQGDEMQDDSQDTFVKVAENAKSSDTLKSKKKDPPVKDGQDWKY
jgi:hypothetical protein